jgi:hypothetical protein
MISVKNNFSKESVEAAKVIWYRTLHTYVPSILWWCLAMERGWYSTLTMALAAAAETTTTTTTTTNTIFCVSSEMGQAFWGLLNSQSLLLGLCHRHGRFALP